MPTTDDYTRTRSQRLASLRGKLSRCDRDDEPHRYERLRAEYESVYEGWAETL